MVKADLTRDYYGDLEISPTADVAEIKKQFKKLGMSGPFELLF
jgi:DnaJ-class molecular chaperone